MHRHALLEDLIGRLLGYIVTASLIASIWAALVMFP